MSARSAVGLALWKARKRASKVRRAGQIVLDRRQRRTYTTSLDHVPSRFELPALLNARGLVGDGAEVGVKRGVYSDFLLSRWRGRKLISVDPWLAAEPDDYLDRANVPQDQHERFYEETRRRLARHGERSDVRRLTSVDGAETVEDASLDFVYIDARHDYESVREDLEAWFPKVRPGGIIAGHDYVDGAFPSGVFSVRRAVDEFFGARGLTVHSTHGKPPVELFPSWLVGVR